MIRKDFSLVIGDVRISESIYIRDTCSLKRTLHRKSLDVVPGICRWAN
jgi:hypothetical protein